MDERISSGDAGMSYEAGTISVYGDLGQHSFYDST